MDSVEYSKESRVKHAKGGMSRCGKTIRAAGNIAAKLSKGGTREYKTDDSRSHIKNTIYCNRCSSHTCKGDGPDRLRREKVIDLKSDFSVY